MAPRTTTTAKTSPAKREAAKKSAAKKSAAKKSAAKKSAAKKPAAKKHAVKKAAAKRAPEGTSPAPLSSDGPPVISVRGAREHNLRNVNVEIPRDRLVVLTGLSGSGKSSLAFDTIYAEGQRRYVESLS